MWPQVSPESSDTSLSLPPNDIRTRRLLKFKSVFACKHRRALSRHAGGGLTLLLQLLSLQRGLSLHRLRLDDLGRVEDVGLVDDDYLCGS